MFWGRGKPHTADSALPHAMFYIIHMNCFILVRRMTVHWRDKAWAERRDDVTVSPTDTQSTAGGYL